MVVLPELACQPQYLASGAQFLVTLTPPIPQYTANSPSQQPSLGSLGQAAWRQVPLAESQKYTPGPVLLPQVPQTPPQPSEPHVRPSQLGLQTA